MEGPEMTEKVMLTFAAKAIGVSIIKFGKTNGAFINNGESWSPATSAHDAFCLAFKLGMDVDFGSSRIVFDDALDAYEWDGSSGSHLAVCEAILKCAAFIGQYKTS